MKNVFTLLIFLTICNISFGQNTKRNRQAIEEKMKAMRVGYITNALELTSEESQKFWPIYNQYQIEKSNLLKETISIKESISSDADGSTFMNKYFELKDKETALEKKYAEKLKSAISVKKVATLFLTEKKFRQEVISKIADRRNK
jgi:hypothetical protein